MKVAVIHGAGDLRLDEVPSPAAGERDVVVQVKCAGICGTDLGFYAGGSPTGAPAQIGHELSGVIAEAGSEVTAFGIGDRVVLNPLVNLVGNGGPEGGFAERLLIRDVVSKPESLIPLPDSLSFESGALIEPLSVSLHAINRANVQPGARIAIFGAGPIGLGLVFELRLKGIDDIIVFDLSEFRRERALALGARAALDPRERDPGEVLKEMHGTTLFFGFIPVAATDIYFDAAGSAPVLQGIFGYARPAATILLLATHKKPVELDLQMMLGKELALIAAVGYPTEMPDVVSMLENTSTDLAPLVSHRFAGGDFLEAFDTARNADISAKVLIEY